MRLWRSSQSFLPIKKGSIHRKEACVAWKIAVTSTSSHANRQLSRRSVRNELLFNPGPPREYARGRPGRRAGVVAVQRGQYQHALAHARSHGPRHGCGEDQGGARLPGGVSPRRDAHVDRARLFPQPGIPVGRGTGEGGFSDRGNRFAAGGRDRFPGPSCSGPLPRFALFL